MIPSLRSRLNVTLWLFGACAAGFVFALLLLVAATRPADALEVPGVGGVVQDPVGTVTKVVEPKSEPAAPAADAPTPAAPAADTPTLAPPSASTPKPAPPAAASPKPALAPIANTVAKVTPSDPLPTAADPTVESPGRPPAGDTPTLLDPTEGAPGLDALSGVTDQLPAVVLPALDLGTIDVDGDGGLPTITLPKADLGGINTDGGDGLSLTLPALDLGGINTDGDDDGLSLTLPALDLGDINTDGDNGLQLTLPAVDLGAVGTGSGGLTLPSLAPASIDLGGVPPPLQPPDLSDPDLPGLGGAARRLTAPTDAPLPLTSDGATVLDAFASPQEPAGAFELVARRAGGVGAFVSASSTSAPFNRQPFDMPTSPSNPSAPTTSSGAAGDGPTRTQTLVWNFAIVLAIAALALEASRWFALRNRLPQSQFLTLLIERPG
jgi:hypothetical protein